MSSAKFTVFRALSAHEIEDTILNGEPAKTPTDEQLDEFERLIHVACAKRNACRGVYVSPAAKPELDAAVANLQAYRANIFEGEQVPA